MIPARTVMFKSNRSSLCRMDSFFFFVVFPVVVEMDSDVIPDAMSPDGTDDAVFAATSDAGGRTG